MRAIALSSIVIVSELFYSSQTPSRLIFLCKISSLSKIDFTFQDLFQLPFPTSLPSLTLSFPFFPR